MHSRNQSFCATYLTQKEVKFKLACTSKHESFQVSTFSYQLKEASVNDANATPPTIGAKEATTHREGFCVQRITKTNVLSDFKNQKSYNDHTELNCSSSLPRKFDKFTHRIRNNRQYVKILYH